MPSLHLKYNLTCQNYYLLLVSQKIRPIIFSKVGKKLKNIDVVQHTLMHEPITRTFILPLSLDPSNWYHYCH